MSDSMLETPTKSTRFGAKPRRSGLTSRYREDHKNPVNHILHVGVGWPMVALAVILLPFRPLWSLGLFVSAYAIMFFGHFAFERNVPTIFKEPATPFVMAFTVAQQLLRAARILPPRQHGSGSTDDTRRSR